MGLLEGDVKRLSRTYRRLHVVRWGEFEHLATKTNHNGTVCVALRGTIGQRVSCAIYENRPQLCRKAIQPGDKICLDVRREVLGE